MKHLGFASIQAVLQYLRYAESQRLDTQLAMQLANIDPKLLLNENGRIKGTQFQILIKSLLKQSKDPLMGLHTSQFVQPGSYNVLGYITMSCATIGEAIARIPPFERLVGDMGVTETGELAEQFFLEWHCAYTDPNVRRHMIDNVLSSWTNYARWLANQDTSPSEVRLQHEVPEPAIRKQYEEFFRCPISFGATHNRILLHKKLLALPLRQPDKLLLKTLESHAASRLSQLNEQEAKTSIRVAQAIQSHLKLGIARKELIAEELGMTPRTLQRKLDKEGSSYQSLLEEIRKEHAFDMLQNSGLAVQDIAFNLGFADSRSFHRSFKKWSGTTPGAYRKLNAPS